MYQKESSGVKTRGDLEGKYAEEIRVAQHDVEMADKKEEGLVEMSDKEGKEMDEDSDKEPKLTIKPNQLNRRRKVLNSSEEEEE